MKKSLLALFLTSFCLTSFSVYAQSALRGGFVENADVFVYVDIAKMNESPFSKAIEAQQSPEEKALADEKTAAFTAATGLTEDDVRSMAFSMDIDNIDFEAADPDELEDAQAVVAIELAKPITLEQAKAGLESMGDEEIDAKITITQEDGLDVIKLESNNTEDGPDKAYGTLSPDGKTFLMAFNTLSLKDSLSRITEGKTAAPTADMAAAMQAMGNRQARIVLVLPAAARQKIQEGIQATAAQGGMGAMIMPFSTAKSLLISADTAESLDFYLSLDLGNAGNAQQATGMVQSMLPMLMMSLGPQAAELSQKIKIAAQDSVVTLSVNMTPEDIKKMTDATAGATGGETMIME
ncbi:hypothetical protein P0Y35_13320 [Kiritimatiellaeota bacterium B1221]|nr:hypothetical protein [Kiritimatiellaeota bacterium B1221]